MSEKLQEFLEKINKDGVKKAEKKAKEIETLSKEKAQSIIESAKEKAQNIIKKSEEEAKKIKEVTENALKQSSRDLLLALKNDIRKNLNDLVTSEVKTVLTREELSKIIEVLITKYVDNNGKVSDLKILLNKDDLEKITSGFTEKLQKKLKDGIEFKASSNINKGFAISFDKGKSFFDFTDEALKEALSSYLNLEVKKLL